MEKDCIFCKISCGEVDSNFIFDGKNFFVIEDVSPVSVGHCLIVSKEHYPTILDLPKELGEELIEMIKNQANRLIKEELADGVKIVQNNFEASGQSVNHFHVHLIPEKKGVVREKRV